VAALTENNVYVADTLKNRVQTYEMEIYPTGLFLNGDGAGITTDEVAVPGTVIATISATDPNVNSAFVYSLQSNQAGCDGSDNAKFLIDGTDLQVADILDTKRQHL